MQTRHLNALRTVLSTSLSLAALGLLGGCAASFTPSAIQSDKAYIGNIQGAVHGGQAPVSGGHIYLYAAGTGGYGTSATSLLSSTGSNTTADGSGNYYVTTDALGNFSLNGDYTCTQGTQVYLVAVGGNPGLSAGTDNTAIVQMAGLGQCPASGNMASQVPYVVINEVSTVAFAYSMGGFGTTPFNVSSPAGVGTGDALAKTGIANAMANTGNIVNIQYGQAPAAANGNPNGVVPVAEIYTLANILAACVNTSSASSAQCQTLFANATSDGTSTGTKATNESEAIFNIVHHPMANVATLYGLQPTTPAFSPNLTSAPNDWTLPIIYKGAVGTPFNVAFDTAGNAWIGDETKGVVKMGPQGSVATYNLNFGAIKGVAVSPNGTVWAPDYTNSKIYILSSTGGLTNTLTGNGLNGPSAVSFDSAGNAYVANETDASVSKFDSTGTAAPPGKSHAVNGITDPAWIAVDTAGNSWIPSRLTNNLGEYTAGNGNSGNAYAYPVVNSYALAIDGQNNIWMGNTSGTFLGLPALYKVTSTNQNKQTATYTTYTGGGMNVPYMVTIDGAGTVWVSNQSAAVVSALSSSGTWLADQGFPTGAGGSCYAATADLSGNMWTANSDGSVTQLLGLATPTAAPLIPTNFSAKP